MTNYLFFYQFFPHFITFLAKRKEPEGSFLIFERVKGIGLGSRFAVARLGLATASLNFLLKI